MTATRERPASVDATGRPPEDEHEQPTAVLRPLIASGLSALAAGIACAGVFGSWAARIIAVLAVGAGIAWAVTVTRRRTSVALQSLSFPIALVLGVVSLVPDSDPSRLPTLVRDALAGARLLKPPVPFDPGWRPLLIVFLFSLAFGASVVAAGWRRPQLGFALPLPVLGLTGVSQPESSEVATGIVCFVLLLVALASLYGGDLKSASELGSTFEAKRAVRGLAFLVPSVVLLVALSRGNFLFPEARYDPSSKPQKPKAVPLSQVRDRVLFEVRPPAGFTGPWKTGALDVYDGSSWRLPPLDDKAMRAVPPDGAVLARADASVSVGFVIRDLGDVAVVPGTANPSRIEVEGASVPLRYDPRAGVFRVASGRVASGMTYRMSLPPYPGGEQLRTAAPPSGIDPELLEVPRPPRPVEDLLAAAPPNAWDKLEFLRGKLYEVAVAKGAGLTREVPPQRVQEILVGNHEASPYELVASEALLARWAGIPSRIGFGFDGFNDESGVLTVRPRNGASWLEVYFEGFGWVPLIASPQQAKASLSTDPTAKFDFDVQASDDVAVELYLPVRLDDRLLAYEIVRHYLVQALPWVLAGALLYLAWPSVLRAVRASRRRRWARGAGVRARIAVEYAELRDLATDLNVGDSYATPIEYLDSVQEDARHEELAWLVSRAMYGDLADRVTEQDALAAERMSESLRKRLFRAQPLTVRLFARVSRASLKAPYTTEVPTLSDFVVGTWRDGDARGRLRARAHIAGGRGPVLSAGRSGRGRGAGSGTRWRRRRIRIGAGR